jgi:RNA polymerase sigma factor (sigma-70 family)
MGLACSTPPDDLLDLTRRTRSQVEGLFRRFGIPAQEREDLVQDALVVVLAREASVENVEAWYLAVLRNKCLHHVRSRRRRLYEAIDRGLLEMVGDKPSLDPEVRCASRQVRSAISTLQEKCRQALAFRYFAGFSGTEMAQRLGCSPVNVRKVTERCLSALSRKLAAPRSPQVAR